MITVAPDTWSSSPNGTAKPQKVRAAAVSSLGPLEQAVLARAAELREAEGYRSSKYVFPSRLSEFGHAPSVEELCAFPMPAWKTTPHNAVHGPA